MGRACANALLLCAMLLLMPPNCAVGEYWTVQRDFPLLGAMTYLDPLSGCIFYVESDGRHLAKIERSGKLDWIKDPREGANVPDYRTDDPKIVDVRAPTQ